MERIQGSVRSFIALAFAISWIAGVAVLVLGQAVLPPDLGNHSDLLVKFGPSLAAVVLVALRGDRRERERFWRSVAKFRTEPGWYALAVLLPLSIAAAVAALHPGTALETMPLGRTFIGAGAMALFLGGGLGEELGWRGYLFPTLSRRHGFFPAVLATATVWCAWHGPMFLLGGGPGFSFGALAVVVFAASLVLGWMYERTGGSVPVCVVFHGAINGGATALAGQAPPGRQPAVVWIYALLLAGVSSLLLLAMLWRGEGAGATES